MAFMRQEVVVPCEKRGTSEDLVVLLHAYTRDPESLRSVRSAVAGEMPDADLLVPALPAARFSMADPVRMARALTEAIDECWSSRKRELGRGYRRIILVGHSLGGLLARKIYVYACGENEDAPFEAEAPQETREWAPSVERIVLFAAMNRGWSISHHMSLTQAIAWRVGTIIGNLLMLIQRRPPLIFTIRKGGHFISQLRIHWLSMVRNEPEKGVGKVLTVQLLGSRDDLVAPEDNVDLLTGPDFIYLDVPQSTHSEIIDLADTKAGPGRRDAFLLALLGGRNELEGRKVIPADIEPEASRPEVTDVIFVIHGIRDRGFWTQKIARRVKALGRKKGKIYATETSTYGYFAMFPFLLPWTRRAKVEWLIDQYTENLALYPNADFSFVGHSNGTYLLAKALDNYPACHFKNVVFAGSVVRTDYDWEEKIRTGRVRAVLNYVATRDWVVAFFPKALEILGLQDLGSAGHDGFACNKNIGAVQQIQFVRGGHGAALREENWDSIAQFIVDPADIKEPREIGAQNRSWLVVLPGFAAPVIWIGIAAFLFFVGHALVGSHLPEWQRTAGLVLYLWGIWRIGTYL
jgi:alpha-beta hydrolase superfamily lysophospholipase